MTPRRSTHEDVRLAARLVQELRRIPSEAPQPLRGLIAALDDAADALDDGGGSLFDDDDDDGVFVRRNRPSTSDIADSIRDVAHALWTIRHEAGLD